MPRISFTANLQRHVPVPTLAVSGITARAALDQAFAAHPQLRSYLVDEQGRLRKHVNLYINERPVADRENLRDPVGPDDELFVFQALSGG